jgi:DNA end-binding protein Ku
MLWPDEVRTPDFAFLDEDVEVRDQELAMAGSLIETLTGDFDPTQFTDSYREALQAVIDAKVEGREVVQPEGAQPTAGTVVDLMAALRASVDAAKAKQSGGAVEAEAPKKPAKKAAAKKSPAKKSTAKSAAKAPAKPRRKTA